MNPWELLGRTATPSGDDLTLMKRSGEFVILAGGKPLMSSRMHGSEEALAAHGCERACVMDAPRVLVGGLGMGFTLRATLDVLPAHAIVVVTELVDGVVAWNRGPLGELAGQPLRDRRVRIEVRDVAEAVRGRGERWDAVLLDVDNGPDAFTTVGNQWLYGDAGLAAIREALTDDGTLAVWSAWEDRRFEQRLRYAGFDVDVQRVRARLSRGGPRHVIFRGRKGVTPSRRGASRGLRGPAKGRTGRPSAR